MNKGMLLCQHFLCNTACVKMDPQTCLFFVTFYEGVWYDQMKTFDGKANFGCGFRLQGEPFRSKHNKELVMSNAMKNEVVISSAVTCKWASEK